MPSNLELLKRAAALAEAAAQIGVRTAMIGGAPYLMGPLEYALWELGITPVYAFSQRESVEKTLPNSDVRKVAVFRHLGWVWVGGRPYWF